MGASSALKNEDSKEKPTEGAILVTGSFVRFKSSLLALMR
jgi:hypothetical protein